MRISNFAKTDFYLESIIKKFSNSFGKEFFIIYANWGELVGSEIASQTEPVRIFKKEDKRFLQIRLKSSSIATILEHGKIIIKDKINFLLCNNFIDNVVFSYSKRG